MPPPRALEEIEEAVAILILRELERSTGEVMTLHPSPHT
jgi:hypothetical protein